MQNLTTTRTAFAAATRQLGFHHAQVPFQALRGILLGLGLVILTDEATEMKDAYLGRDGKRWVLPVGPIRSARPAHWSPLVTAYTPSEQTRLVLEWSWTGQGYDVNAYLS